MLIGVAEPSSRLTPRAQVTAKVAENSVDTATALSQKLADPTVLNTQLIQNGMPQVHCRYTPSFCHAHTSVPCLITYHPPDMFGM